MELSSFLMKYEKDLSYESQCRIERGNFLRVLDSKDKADQDILLNAPLISKSLTKASQRVNILFTI